MKLVANWDPHPTFFEIATALALKYFTEHKGGCRDSGNRIGRPARCDERGAIERFGHHADRSRSRKMARRFDREIAGEKAGIIKAQTPVISAPQLPRPKK